MKGFDKQVSWFSLSKGIMILSVFVSSLISITLRLVAFSNKKTNMRVLRVCVYSRTGSFSYLTIFYIFV